ncbi:hypothetical protein MNBD_ALPHA01-1392 [hydrothermal vent metagenome]|uniref:Gfo/Idh/MocA-like oxidoreductase N-terminal domain-containing protein n=1 Tax=hydrothermal vent metagenome TaxID=652676 RepID=A0A3B0S1I7_9ZZZZ
MARDQKAKFSVLIIGCGAIAGGYDEDDLSGPNILTHAKAFNFHHGFNLAGCMDTSEEVAQNFSRTWGVNKVYSRLDQALDNQHFDIISICSSTASHEGYLRQLQDYQARLIFCEKPITDNFDTAREMTELYQDNLAVNYSRRFNPAVRQLAQDISQGKYGRFNSGKAIYNKGLYNNGSHMTDLLHMLLGPLLVKEGGGIIHDFWPGDPTVSAELTTASGAAIDMTGTDMRQGMTFDLTLEFEQARIILDDFSRRLIIKPSDGPEMTVETGLNRAMLHAVSNIYDHLTGGAVLFSTGENALSALKVCAEIRQKAGLP